MFKEHSDGVVRIDVVLELLEPITVFFVLLGYFLADQLQESRGEEVVRFYDRPSRQIMEQAQVPARFLDVSSIPGGH